MNKITYKLYHNLKPLLCCERKRWGKHMKTEKNKGNRGKRGNRENEGNRKRRGNM
jgi:hypothetical protein